MLAGFFAIVILSIGTDMVMHAMGIFPAIGEPIGSKPLLLATAYRILYGVVGGYITARLAPREPMAHALVLGVVGLLVSILGAVLTWSEGPAFGPHWYPVALIVVAIPCAWLGGRLFVKKARAAASPGEN